MERVTLQAALRDAAGKEKDGRFHIPERKKVSMHLSRAVGGVVLRKVTAVQVAETHVRIDTSTGETFYVAYEDVRAVAIEEKEKKAGFV